MNEAWHRANRLPPKASRDERVAWHLEHMKNCGCRPVPENLAAEVSALDKRVKKTSR